MARRVKTDRFGNAFQNIPCTENKNGYPVGYLELGSKLYKIEPSQNTSTDEKTGKEVAWVRVTAIDKKKKHQSM